MVAKAEKAEPDLDEVNRLIRGESSPGTVSQTVNVEYALAALRSENASLKNCARVNAEREAGNEKKSRENYEVSRRENLRLQTELLASQEKVFQLQDKLLAMREIANSPSTKENER